MGLRATSADARYWWGVLRYLEREGVAAEESLRERARAAQELGQTVAAVAVDGQGAGMLGIADALRGGSREAVRALKSAGLEVVMLTGDNERAARAIAGQVGIEEVRAGGAAGRQGRGD